MFNEDMYSELLVELSDEQQQLVAGGSSEDVLKDKLSTFFKTDESITLLDVAQQSNAKGSTNLQKFQNAKLSINTAAYKDLYATLS